MFPTTCANLLIAFLQNNFSIAVFPDPPFFARGWAARLNVRVTRRHLPKLKIDLIGVTEKNLTLNIDLIGVTEKMAKNH